MLELKPTDGFSLKQPNYQGDLRKKGSRIQKILSDQYGFLRVYTVAHIYMENIWEKLSWNNGQHCCLKASGSQVQS